MSPLRSLVSFPHNVVHLPSLPPLALLARQRGFTALHTACRVPNPLSGPDIIRVLVRGGADIHAKNKVAALSVYLSCRATMLCCPAVLLFCCWLAKTSA